MNLFENNGATFSEDGNHRLKLWRIWDENLPIIMFIGLNPSTANSSSDDPTIRRIKRFTSDWGYGGFYMMNLFTQITPYPKELKLNSFKELHENRVRIRELNEECKITVCCWGNFKQAAIEGEYCKCMEKSHCLGMNKNGSPKHPLYLKSDVKPIKLYL